MKFRLYKEYGALNSAPIFAAFEKGVKALGHEIVKNDEDIPVIWSVLWAGRMAANRTIFETAKRQGKPVIIIEVGNLLRGTTWRICLDHINNQGFFGNSENLDSMRPEKLGVQLHPEKLNRPEHILIASQHDRSLQWQGMPSMNNWIEKTVREIRQFSDRKIIVRPHPRSPIGPLSLSNVELEKPVQLKNTYDSFDIDYLCHCVVNYNSGPAVQAAIHGIPVICDQTSLANPISGQMENIEDIVLPDRTEWFLKLCHTEWTINEIATGAPLDRLLKK